jgi:DNA-binding NarL/FixJ family response regulator
MSYASETTMVRVMVVEDHDDLRQLLSERIDQEPDLEVVSQAGSLGEARYLASSHGCDVAVLDIGLPDGNGADLIAELRELCPGCAVLIFSASLNPSGLARASEAGADEIMDKFTALEKIVETIRLLGNT